ncbi:MAG: nucleoside kinase [Bacilli bacterium]|nr:nucleoside kinase [Bacilli bacterium]
MRKLKLKYKGKVLEGIEVGTTLLEVSKLVKDDYKYPIVGAKIGSYITDLNTKVTKNEKVEFYDLSSTIGNRIYSRSLEFLTTYASKKVLGSDTDVMINYSLENGIYCEIVGKKINSISINKIEEEMKNLVKEKLPFTSIIVDRVEAINYLKRHGQKDKGYILKYLTDDTISVYQLENGYDYFYGSLVHDTSVLKKFELKYNKNNSFILLYPTASSPNRIKKYIEHPLTNNTYKNFTEWGRRVGVTTVPQLNEIISQGQGEAVVRLFEAHYNEEISEVIEEVCKKRDKIKMILLAGPSSSGKTTTSKKLGLYLRDKGIRFKKVSLDDYFVDRIHAPKDENGNYDYSDIDALDVRLFQKQLLQMLDGQKVLMPNYDFVLGKKIYNKNYIKLEEGDMLVIEGIHTLNEKLTSVVPRENKFKIFQCPLVNLKLDNHNRLHTTDVRKLRRIVRDNTYRGTSAEETLAMWPNVDKEAEKNIYPYQDDADAIINSSLGYELNVLRIYAEPLLYGIDVNSNEYPEAKRLLRLLRNFLTISSEVVPRDSILREFIGGSIFRD